ncbi:peptidoglycan editing factor PgeF [Pelotomaculum propionicicum]|uniref:Purine nucleoside phosphorylase n=1 Tax=Pelotomaculum propionicicum TaxID=258475 RepID=A0A4Y7RNQ1_9FIRM|nr:peptidoglycan editing factor PgeF [Pelotomaculum propionicicum]NLI12876.1 peptidoglycan editing factor PgeF [Peptococcaceae bacterium]TEB10302.1 Laccase domain protein YfiH [Pelotomaculum propionicicum]
MPETRKNELEVYTFPHLHDTGLVTHGFTTRAGGVSKGHWQGLNTAFHVGDRESHVKTNRAQACQALGINPAFLVAGDQVHGDVVSVVGEADKGRGAFSEKDALPGTDALVTAAAGLPLASFYADCVPIFLLDPVSRVVALAHAGWKGTALKIGQKTVEKMEAAFGTDPRDCLAGIGPSIGPCCYEVDEVVIDQFRTSMPDLPGLAGAAAPGKWKLNLWEANCRVLLDAGLKPANIWSAEICTSCHSDTFFSYRAHQGKTGRMMAIIMLK